MNLKSKLFGTLAAASMALSMMGGVASADDASVSVKLNPGVCSASIVQSNFNFGNWSWDSETNKYVAGFGAATSFPVSAEIRVPSSGGTCQVTAGLVGDELTGASHTIPGSALSLTLTGLGTHTLGSSQTHTSPRLDVAGTIVFDATNTTYQPDNYTGTLRLVVGSTLGS